MGAMLLVVVLREDHDTPQSVTSVGELRSPKPAGVIRQRSRSCLTSARRPSVPTITRAQSICESCEVQLGLGGTYHFWARLVAWYWRRR